MPWVTSGQTDMSKTSTNGTAANDSFQTLGLAQVQGELVKLYQNVAAQKGRVQIKNPVKADGSCDCVLISAAELESLETALEILSDTPQVQALRQSLADVVHTVDPALG